MKAQTRQERDGTWSAWIDGVNDSIVTGALTRDVAEDRAICRADAINRRDARPASRATRMDRHG